jgi:hypothetical protein
VQLEYNLDGERRTENEEENVPNGNSDEDNLAKKSADRRQE